jgi:hypothetical protein
MSATAAQQLAREEAPSQPEAARFDRAAIHAHIKLLHDLAAATGVDGVLVLACYGENPDSRRKVGSTVERFGVGDTDSMVDAIMATESVPYLNVYVPWGVYRHGLAAGERGRTKDLLCTLALVADLDADTGKTANYPYPHRT